MSGGCVVKVWFDPASEVDAARSKFLVIETSFPDFESFCLAVDANRLIGGDVLSTRRVGADLMAITRRSPIAFRGCAVLRTMLPTFNYTEDDDE